MSRFPPTLRGLRTISRTLANDATRGDTGYLDGFHYTPIGDSDMSQRSRVSLLSAEMLESKQIGVRGLSYYGFRLLDGTFLYGPIALFPKTALSWRVQSVEDITPRSLCLFTALEPKIDILVLGVGDKKNIDSVRKRVYPYLRDHKIGLEIMDSEDAIATFNFLNSERRYVAAALYPPDDMTVSDAEYGRALNLLKRFDVLDENPLFLGLNDTMDRTEDLIKKLWDGKGDFNKIREKVLSLRESNNEEKRPPIEDDTPKKKITDS